MNGESVHSDAIKLQLTVWPNLILDIAMENVDVILRYDQHDIHSAIAEAKEVHELINTIAQSTIRMAQKTAFRHEDQREKVNKWANDSSNETDND